MTVYPFSDCCSAEVYEDTRCVVTRFYDGSSLPAAPQDDRGYANMAEGLGYGTGEGAKWQMCRDHELLHSWLSVRCGREISPTLWAEAHGCREGTAGVLQRLTEEGQVLAFQAFTNGRLLTAQEKRDLMPLERFGRLDDMRREALVMLRGTGGLD